MHLIYETEQEALDRADEWGKAQNLSYWITGKGSRWVTAPAITADGKWALDVDGAELSEEEESAISEEVVFPVEEVIDMPDDDLIEEQVPVTYVPDPEFASDLEDISVPLPPEPPEIVYE